MQKQNFSEIKFTFENKTDKKLYDVYLMILA